MNIEDQFWLDYVDVLERVPTLGQDKVIGNAIRFFRFAQEEHKKGKLLSEQTFKEKGFLEELIPTFAKRTAEGIQVVGAEKHFSWLDQRIEAGRRGGLARGGGKKQAAEEREKRKRASKQVRLALSEGSLKRPDQCSVCNSTDSRIEAHHVDYDKPLEVIWLCTICHGNEHTKENNHKRAEASKSKSLKPQPSSSSSSSSSFSLSPTHSPSITATNEFIAAYCERFKVRWGLNPAIRKKDAGVAKRISAEIPRKDLEFFLDAFFSMPDAWIIKAKHPIAAMESRWNEIGVWAKSKEFTSGQQARDADKSLGNELLRRKIISGQG